MAYHLAQLNVAHAKSGDPYDASMAPFWAETARINALADADPGLIWRLQDTVTGDARSFTMPGQDKMIVNLSVWADLRALHGFVYRGQHAEIIAKSA